VALAPPAAPNLKYRNSGQDTFRCDTIAQQIGNVPRFQGNFGQWERQFISWVSLYGLDLRSLSQLSATDNLPISEHTDLTLYAVLLRAFESAPEEEYISRTGNHASGFLAWHTLIANFYRSRYSAKFTIYQRIKTLASSPPEPSQPFEEWEAKFRQNVQGLQRLAPSFTEDIVVMTLMGQTPVSSDYANLVAQLNEHESVSLDDVFEKFQSYHSMRQNQLLGARNSLAPPTQAGLLATQDDKIQQQLNKLTDIVQGLVKSSRSTPNRSYDPSKCNRCGDPVTDSHTSRTCPKCGPFDICANCGKEGHLAIACRSWPSTKKQSSPAYSGSKSTSPPPHCISFVLDSGCSKSIVANSSLVHSLAASGPASVYQGLSGSITAAAHGSRVFRLSTTNSHVLRVTLPVEVVPTAAHNLLSAHALVTAGYTIKLGGPRDSYILGPNNQRIPLRHSRGLFFLDEPLPAPVHHTALLSIDDAHLRFGHRNERSLRHTSRYVRGMDISTQPATQSPCLPCASGKLHKTRVGKGPHAPRCTGPFQAFSIDATGFKTPSRYGNRFAHCCKDMFSGRCYTFCTPSLTGPDLVTGLRTWFATWLPVGHPTRSIRYHCDAAYLHGSVRALFDELGMVPHVAAPLEHSTHGHAERSIGLLDQTVTTLLTDAGLPPSFWEDATLHHDYVFNRLSPTTGGPPPLTKEDPSRILDASVIHRFGCLAYFRREPRQKSTFEPKGRYGIFLGVSSIHTHGTFRIFTFDTREIVFSRSATIFDRHMPGLHPDMAQLHSLVPDSAPLRPSSGAAGTTSALADTLPIDPPASSPLSPLSSAVQEVRPVVSPNTQREPGHVPRLPVPTPSMCSTTAHDLRLDTCSFPLLCDNCQTTIPPDVVAFQCANCDYDECVTCHDPSLRVLRSSGASHQPRPTSPSAPLAPVEEVMLADHAKITHHDQPAQEVPRDGQAPKQKDTILASEEVPQDDEVESNHEHALISIVSDASQADLAYVYEDPNQPVSCPDNNKYDGLRSLSSHDQTMWAHADKAELAGLVFNNTLKEVSPSDVQGKAYPCKMVRTKKSPDADGRVRLKSRIVVRGDLMRNRTPTRDWSAPVVSSVVPKIMSTIALTTSTQLATIDIAQAFLKAQIYDDDIFIKIKDTDQTWRYYVLLGSLYGIPSAPGRWYDDFGAALESFGLLRSLDDPCLYVSPDKTEMVCTHVDDGLTLMSPNRRTALIQHLETIFGDASVSVTVFEQDRPCRYLGITWTMDYANRTCTLNQTDYIQAVLEDFDMDKSKATATPATTDRLPKHDKDERHPMYQSWTGTLQWILATRPDISHAVKEVSRHNQRNGTVHHQAVKRIFRYLNGTLHQSLTLRGLHRLSDLQLTGFSDASFAECISTRQSTHGIVLSLGGGALLAKTSLQRTVSMSACEAELYAICEVALTIVYLRRLLETMGQNQSGPTRIFTDSQSAIALLKRTSQGQRSKHVDVRIHKIRELIKENIVELKYLRTDIMPADLLTKNLRGPAFTRHRSTLMDARLNQLSAVLEEVYQDQE